MTISSIIIFLCILFVLVVVHEFGHFVFAKFFKMRVDEFAFGFPPRLLKKKIGETVYSFNLVPLGGYVKIFGENGLDQDDIQKLSDHDNKRLFGNKSALQRIVVLCGGVLFNILGAIVLFAIAFMIGSNIYLSPEEVAGTSSTQRDLVIVDINPKSPLAGTGISLGNSITSIEADNQTLTGDGLSSQAAAEFIQTHNNSMINIFYKNENGYVNNVYVVPQAGIVDGKKVLGAKFADTAFKKYSLTESITQSVKVTFQQLGFIFTSLASLVNDMIFKDAKVEDNLSGPIGLAMMTSKVSEKGIDQILIFAAMLSLSLAAFNILPIPALDGGRVMFVLLEVLKGKKVKASTEQLFHGLGFLLLLCLMLFVTYFDVVKAFN